MTILINQQPAVLKKGTSFDYISENSFFTGADSYTLSITFPLKDCPENIAIFGHLNRKDCDFSTTLLDCEIHDRNFHKYGVVNIVELSEIEVKVQFLSGRSKQNYYTTFDDVYINEITYGSAWVVPESTLPSGYTQVEYLQSDSDALIDTGIAGGSNDLEIECKFSYSTHINYAAIYANFVSDSYNAIRCILGSSSNKILLSNNTKCSSGNTSITCAINTEHVLISNYNTITLDGTETTITNTTSGTSNTTNIALFNRSVSSPYSTRDIGLKIFYFIIRDGGTEVLHLIPCKRDSDSELGMYDTVNNTFLTNAGSDSFTAGSEITIDVSEYMKQYGENTYNLTFMPWVNNTSGNIQNTLVYDSSTQTFSYDTSEVSTLVGQPYLMYVLQTIFDNQGYTYDLSELENSQWNDVVICNALPYAWGLEDIKYCLPHWTITEFLEELEWLTNGRFDIDEVSQTVTFSFNQDLLSDAEVVQVDDIVDTFAVDVEDADEADNTYSQQRNLSYTEGGHQMSKYYDCQWAVNSMTPYYYSTISNLIDTLSNYLVRDTDVKHSIYRSLHYAADIDTYFVLRVYDITYYSSGGVQVPRYYSMIQPVNAFAPRIVDSSEDADSTEISIVPVCIDITDTTNGNMIFIECGTYGGTDSSDDEDDQTPIVNTLTAGEQNKKEEYLDKIYIGFWDGNYSRWGMYMPHPLIDRVEMGYQSNYQSYNYSMRLTSDLVYSGRESAVSIDQSRKYTFKFISDTIPDVRSVFLINGKKYLAEKITATFNAEQGMSQLLKMDAYRVED